MSSLAMFEAAIWVKMNASDKIMFENQKKMSENGNERNVYINFHIKDRLEI